MIDRNNKDIALAPLIINHNPDHRYAFKNRFWQGTTAFECTHNEQGSRLWLSVMAGSEELEYTYVDLRISDDEGKTWSAPVLVVDGSEDGLRIFDQVLWTDPLGKLWFFYSQMYGFGDGDGRVGCWAICCENPMDEKPVWSKARRISNGVMRNKPTVRSDEAWLLPIAVWHNRMSRNLNWLPDEEFSNVFISEDSGVTFRLLGHADVPDRDADEHMIVELSNGTLWMLVRAKYGIGQAYSYDGGKTWEKEGDSGIWGPTSRFFIRKLQNDHLLLVNHALDPDDSPACRRRANLTAWISLDDGKTFQGGLLLDERDEVSYPDGFQLPDGRIFIAYDRERYGVKEILTASFTEDEILSRTITSPFSYTKQIVKICDPKRMES